MAEPEKTVNFGEIGSTGLQQYGGFIQDEFLTVLRGPKAAEVYREMSLNDAVIGAILFLLEMMIREVKWPVEPFAATREDQERADRISGMFDDMSFTWRDTVAEICTMFTFGWAWLELVFKRAQGMAPGQDEKGEELPDSKFNDGLIEWRKWAIRAQETLFRWNLDEHGGIKGMIQSAAPRYQPVEIPISKSLLFRTRIERNNPEGLSMLRRCYRSWFYKKRIEEVQGIGIERDLAGLPMLTPPENMDIWNDKDSTMVSLKAKAERLVRSIRRNEQEGILKPNGWELELLTTGGRRQFETLQIIEYYDVRMAMTVFADMLFLGHEESGSWALASSKTKIFAKVIGSFLDSIKEVINRRAIPQVLSLNGWPVDRPPKLTHGDVETPDLAEVGAYILQLTQAGMPLDDGLFRHLRRIGNLPEPEEDDLSKGAGERGKFLAAVRKFRQRVVEWSSNGTEIGDGR